LTEDTPSLRRTGYTLVIGEEGEDRAWVMAALRWARMEAAAATEAELFQHPDWVPPWLVILDDVAGGEARRKSQARIRAHPALKGVPVLILSFEGDIDSYSGAITKGAAAYLVKPVGAEELTTVARKLSDWIGAGDQTEKRRRLRRPILMKIDVDIRARRLRIPGELVEASGTGCRIEVGQELYPGELVRVILHGPDDSTHVALGAEVRWHDPGPKGEHVAGLRFTGTTALLAGKLLGFASTGTT
jgi:DNA-binding response OmpR family regulator